MQKQAAVHTTENTCKGMSLHRRSTMTRVFGGAMLAALLASATAQAAWQLDGASSALHFVSVKNATVAETHHFKQLQGQWADDGQLSVSIPVQSLETLIPIRNERMLEHVLKAKDFPLISATATVAPSVVKNIAVGTSSDQDVSLKLTIAGQSQDVSAKVRITKLADQRFNVATLSPVLLNTVAFKLDTGVAKLQELAKLQQIDAVVPVSFNVNFVAAK